MTKLLAGVARLYARVCQTRAAFVSLSGVALLVAGALLALAGPSSADHGEGSASIAPGPEAFAQPAIRRGLAEGRERAERRRQDRETTEARQRRRNSRNAHRGRSRGEALALARERHPGVLTARPWRSLRLEDGQQVEAYRGDYGALVSVGGGREALAESTLPLRALDESGNLAPVDLNLEDRGLEFVPKTPLIDIRISKLPARGVAFERAGFRFGFEGLAPLEAPVTTDGKAFWGNVATDMDLLLRPVPFGVESFFVLRSAESPESAMLAFELPPGAALRKAAGDDQVVEIVRGSATIGRVEAPAAYDAEGEPVPVGYEVQGSKLAVQFPHRDGDYAYPLMVDPIVGDTVKENFNLNGDGGRAYPNDPFSGWGFFENAPTAGYFPHYVSTEEVNRGLTVYAYQGVTYSDGWYGEWYWQAPRQAYIERADFGYVYHTSPWGTCALEGIYSSSRGNWDYGTWREVNGTSGSSPTIRQGEACIAQNANYKAHCVGNSCIPHDPLNDPRGTPANLMVVGLFKNGTHTLGSYPTVRMEGATMWLFDNDVPNMAAPTHPDLPTGWTKSAKVTTTLTATEPDPGLGVKTFKVFGGASLDQLLAKEEHDCWGDRHKPCPVTWSKATTWSTDSLPEGVNTIRAAAYDAIGKCRMPTDSGTQCRATATADWTIKVDRTGPKIEQPAGPLFERRNQTADHRKEGLYETDYPVTVSAGDPHSGVKTLRLEVDGQLKASYDPACNASSGCPTSPPALTWSLHSDDYSDGDHVVRVTATDATGNDATPVQWTVTVDRRGDIYNARHYTGNPAAGGELVAEEWGRAGTRNGRHQDPDVIHTRETVPCDDAQPSGPACDEVRLASRLADDHDDAKEAYEVTRGASTTDPTLPAVVEILEPSIVNATEAARGPIEDILEPWQTAPPASGPQYIRYDTPFVDERDGGDNATISLWVDSARKMPLKEVLTRPAGGGPADATYYDYSRGRFTADELPAGFFRVSRPANTGKETYVHARGNQRMSTARDRETGSMFRPHFLGTSPSIPAAGTFCLNSTDLVEFASTLTHSSTEIDPEVPVGPVPPSQETLVAANYSALPSGATCAPGQNAANSPPLDVVSFATASTNGAQWLEQYRTVATLSSTDPTDPDVARNGAVPVTVGGALATAYVVARDDNSSSALLVLGDTTLIVSGPFEKASLQLVLSQLVPQ